MNTSPAESYNIRIQHNSTGLYLIVKKLAPHCQPEDGEYHWTSNMEEATVFDTPGEAGMVQDRLAQKYFPCVNPVDLRYVGM